MPMLDLDQIEALSPDKSVATRDPVALRYVLDRGWAPRQIRQRGGRGTRDLAVPLKVIIAGWEEGWRLLGAAFPDIRLATSLWHTALQHAQPGIVADMISHGMPALERTESGWSAAHLLIHAVAQEVSMPWGAVDEGTGVAPDIEARSAATLEVLAKAGVNVNEPFPGPFSTGDLSPAGHTVWTRAVAHQRWLLAADMFPDTWEALLLQPRALEAASYLRVCALRGREEPMVLWQRWLNAFLAPWLEAVEQARASNRQSRIPHPVFDRPDDAPFLMRMPKPVRLALWFAWARPDEDGWSGLHQLALSATDSRAVALLRCIHADEGACLKLWGSTDEGGVSPAALWALAHRDAQIGASAAVNPDPWPLDRALSASCASD